jgi:hypothetical protein
MICEVDLIRHGKHARADQNQKDTHPSAVSAPLPDRHNRDQQGETHHTTYPPSKREPVAAHQVHVGGGGANKGDKYAKEAEAIVKEEREAKSKMPVYAGLENFKLLDKMGE